MNNQTNPIPKKSNLSSSKSNSLHVQVITSSINSNIEGNNHPPSDLTKEKHFKFTISLKNLIEIIKLLGLYIYKKTKLIIL
jgi:hypothetical protein